MKAINYVKYGIFGLLGIIVITTVSFFLIGNSISNDLAESIGEITGVILVVLLIIQLLPPIAKSLLTRVNLSFRIDKSLRKIIYLLKPLHYVIGLLFVGIVFIHLISNLFYDIEFDLEVVTGIVYGFIILITVLYGILSKFKNLIHLTKHRFWAIITFIFLILHLID